MRVRSHPLPPLPQTQSGDVTIFILLQVSSANFHKSSPRMRKKCRVSRTCIGGRSCVSNVYDVFIFNVNNS